MVQDVDKAVMSQAVQPVSTQQLVLNVVQTSPYLRTKETVPVTLATSLSTVLVSHVVQQCPDVNHAPAQQAVLAAVTASIYQEANVTLAVSDVKHVTLFFAMVASVQLTSTLGSMTVIAPTQPTRILQLILVSCVVPP